VSERVFVDCSVVREDGTVLPDAGIHVRGGRIAAVGAVDDVRGEAGGAPAIALGGAHVLPGLITMHTHLSDSARETPARLYSETQASRALLMAGTARQTLHAGVTTVRLVAEADGTDFALRAAIEAGQVEGPRIFTAGRALVCTGGHGSTSALTLEADGADGFRRAARSQIKLGADLIKLMISGGIAGEHEGIDTPQLTRDELEAVTSVAHDWGRKVTAHAGPPGAIRQALECGLDGVEHGYQLDEPTIRFMAERATTYVPTILVTRCEDYYRDVGAPEWLIERALGAGPVHWRALELAVEHGVRIAVGTDMLPGEPYEETTATVRELEHYVEAGLTPAQALAAATTVPAAWLGAAGELGAVRAGAHADLIAVDGDPVQDISALRRLRLVVKAGEIVPDERATAA
jgi:imidazolonepropionase-like amidohydrolase